MYELKADKTFHHMWLEISLRENLRQLFLYVALFVLCQLI